MASTIASELLAAINAVPYNKIIAALPTGVGLSEKVYPKTRLAQTYTLDTKHWIDGSFMNPNAMFELFGEYNGLSGMDVRKCMIKFIGVTKKIPAERCPVLQDEANVALHM